MADLRLLEDFKYLFSGCEDAFGTELGGCIRLSPPWEAHLDGNQKIGIYPTWIEGGNRLCNWGAVDLDVRSENKKTGDYESPDEAHTAAINVCRALKALGLKGWIEGTRSNGRHVWVFKRGVEMATMRKALLVACSLVKVPPTEVNPKSLELADDELGNYVRLPYPGAGSTRFTTERAIMSTSVSFMQVANFVSAALEGVDDLSALEAAARLYKAPETLSVPARDPSGRQAGEAGCVAPTNLRGLPRAIWAEGRLEGADRSGTLFKMAVALCKQGYPVDEGAEILFATDEKWFEKYTNRKNPWRWYVETMQNAQTASRDG